MITLQPLYPTMSSEKVVDKNCGMSLTTATIYDHSVRKKVIIAITLLGSWSGGNPSSKVVKSMNEVNCWEMTEFMMFPIYGKRL